MKARFPVHCASKAGSIIISRIMDDSQPALAQVLPCSRDPPRQKPEHLPSWPHVEV
jgi:hypothetical protein